ncbi:MAG: V-type ATP synthase subunit K [Candidatus Hadarchaeales archaeon]
MVNDLALVVLAAGLAVAIPGIMSAIGVAMAGMAAAAATAEDPKKFSKLFILEVLPGTQGIYGFIAGFMILIFTGVLGTGLKAGVVGFAILAAALPAILQGFTAIFQGKVATASVAAVAKKPEVFTAGMMYTVMVELYAILGLLATILMLTSKAIIP